MQRNKAYTVTYELDESTSILIRTIRGEITMCELIELWESDMRNKHVRSELKAVITDLSKGKNLAKMEERKDMEAFYRKHFALFENMKIAVVLNDSSVAIPIMYQHENQEFQHLAFSSVEAAIKWAKE